MPFGPFNPAEKYLIVIHCGLHLSLPDRLALLDKHGSVITIALPRDLEHDIEYPPRSQPTRSRFRDERIRTRGRSRSPMRSRPRAYRLRPPPQLHPSSVAKSVDDKREPFILSHVRQLDQISSKAFYAGNFKFLIRLYLSFKFKRLFKRKKRLQSKLSYSLTILNDLFKVFYLYIVKFNS